MRSEISFDVFGKCLCCAALRIRFLLERLLFLLRSPKAVAKAAARIESYLEQQKKRQRTRENIDHKSCGRGKTWIRANIRLSQRNAVCVCVTNASISSERLEHPSKAMVGYF